VVQLVEQRITASGPRLAAQTQRQTVPCNLCGSADQEAFCPENGRGLVRCVRCSLVYVSPRPSSEDLYALYDERYFKNAESVTVGYTDYFSDELNIRQTSGRRLRRIERFVRPGRLLDMGCATGFFLDEARLRGWDVTGIDISRFAIEYARSRFGFDARHGSFTQEEFSESSFDLVTMWDVIEHVPDPRAYIHKAAAVLKTGGVLTLATPDVDSWPARLTGRKWIGYKLSDEHLYYFSRNTLRRLLHEAGLEVVDTFYVGKYVTMRLFLDRFNMYAPWLAKPAQAVEKTLKLSQASLYVNPFDIIAVTARKR
jgi:2-polyprenyl-3-methyl-5-hydroxy-6-metoxy-1,4-benzoquinol methylase